MQKRSSVGIILAVALLVLVTACSSKSASSTAVESPATSAATSAAAAEGITQIQIGKLNFDMSKYCGTKPFTLGILDGYGGNTWAVEKRAMLTKLAKSCPNNTKVLYFDANGDVQKYISTVNSWAAQGVNIIETFDLFGQPPVSAFTKAQAAGVLIGTGNGIPGDAKVPTDVTAAVVPDFEKQAVQWVSFFTKATNNKGRIALIGGPAGNLFDRPAIEAIKKAIVDQGSGITLAVAEPQVGNWDPATTQQVMTGLLQKDSHIDGVLLTYTATGPAILRAYKAAGLPFPAIAGQSSSNELVCLTESTRKTDPNFQVMSLDGSANLDAIALAKIFAAFQGIAAPELGPTNQSLVVTMATYIDTLSGIMPPCDSTLPPGADLSTALTVSEIKAAIG